MSLYDYEQYRRLLPADAPFASLIMAAYRKADTTNASLLRISFPEITSELQSRYNAPGGRLVGDPA